MGIISRAIVGFSSFSTFAQVLLYLPLALDIAGKECFLALSAALATYYFVHATFDLLARNTRLALLSQVFAVLQIVLIPVILLVCFNLYGPDDAASSHSSHSWAFRSRSFSFGNGGASNDWGGAGVSALLSFCLSWAHFLLIRIPHWWATLLYYLSPLFALLEGVSSLLVIQSVAQISRWFANHRGEAYQFGFLFAAAAVYVASAVALWGSFEYAAGGGMLSAALVGASVTATLFLTAIAFAVGRGNVVETSLMLAYVCWNVYLLGVSVEGGLDPIQLIRSFKSSSPPLPPLILRSWSTILSILTHTFGQGIDLIYAACSALPLPVLISLVYRIAVLSAASRILPAIKKAHSSTGWYEDENDGQGPRLSEEEPFAMSVSIVVSYSRVILVAVYTHLLLLDQSHHLYWRWMNVFITLAVWAVELLMGRDGEGEDSLTKDWKVD